MLVTVLVGTVNYGRSGNRNMSKEKYLIAKKKNRKNVYRAKCKEDKEIRNVL